MEIKAAYGRRYETKKSFIEDFVGNKDFKIVGGPYTSIRDLNMMIEDGVMTCHIEINNKIIYIIRYGKIQDLIFT